MSLIERAAARLQEKREREPVAKAGSTQRDSARAASELAEVALREQKRRAAVKAARRATARLEQEGTAIVPATEPASASENAKLASKVVGDPQPDVAEGAGVPGSDKHASDSDASPDHRSDESKTRRSGRRLKLRLANVQAEYYLNRKGAAPAVVSQFRSIRRPLIANAQGRGLPAVDNGRTIMVTSAMPGEGKTFCSIHLAMAISIELDCQVILVELDLIKPSVMKSLGVSPMHGVTDWFKDKNAHIRDYVVDTNVRDLAILPSGTGASGAANMLASKRLEAMFKQLREAYPNHYLVLDTPPVIPASEARVLPNYAGQVAFVVAAGETPTSAVTEGLEHVQGCEVVGLIMNKFRPEKVYSSYGY